MTITIDPTRLNIVDEAGNRIEDVKDLTNIPDCPVCAEPVDVDRICVTLNERDQAENGDRYVVGRWSCPRGCDPKTRRRFHGQVTLEGDGSVGHLVCSCGEDVTVPIAEFGPVVAAHPVRGYTDIVSVTAEENQ